MAHLTNPPTLEFKEAFLKGHSMSFEDIPLILQCKNIDFGHVKWPGCAYRIYYNHKQLMFHIIDNIMDINVMDNNLPCGFALLCKVCSIEGHTNSNIVDYVINNGYINNLTFIIFKTNHIAHVNKNYSMVHFEKLINYLTEVSFDKFRGYYNIEKYYYMIHTMFLIMKVQQKSSVKNQLKYSLPNTIIKHLIIPFIYQ